MMNNLLTLIKKEFLELQRTNKIIILGIVLLFVAIASPITAKLIPDILKNMDLNGINITIPTPTWSDAIDQFMKNLGQFGVIVLIFLFAGSVSDEKQRKTFEILLTKPVARQSIIFAKLITAVGTLLALFIVACAGFALYTNSLFAGLPVARFALLAGIVFIFLIFMIVLTISVSAHTKSYLAALGLMSFFYLIMLPLLSLFEQIKPYLPDYIFSQYKNFLNSGDLSLVYRSVGTSLLFGAIVIAFAVHSFNKQEVER
jgi:ABC-2 type transport system permease protein